MTKSLEFIFSNYGCINISNDFSEICKLYPIYKKINKEVDLEKLSTTIFNNKGSKFKKILLKYLDYNNVQKIQLLPYLDLSKKFIKMGYNPDILYNYLSAAIEKIDSLDFNLIVGTTSLNNIKKIHKIYPAKKENNYKKNDRILILFFENKQESHLSLNELISHIIKDIDIISELSKQELIDKKIVPKKPKSLLELHQYLGKRIEENFISNKETIKLSPREDLLNLDNKKIKIENDEYIISVAKTNHDLIKFGSKYMFDNCVGRFDCYVERAKAGSSTVVGIFKGKKPLYCIETTKYSFKEAKGVSNSYIGARIFSQLEALLTIPPVVPEDFVPMRHTFLSGYKYSEEKKSLFLMYKKGGIYEYSNISMDIYERFVDSDYVEKNKIFHNEIKNVRKHPFERLKS